MNDSVVGDGPRTWVQVRFYQEAGVGPINHVWTVALDYAFHETPQFGDTIIVRGFEQTVEASGVNEDGSIDFVTRFDGTSASVPLEVMGRAWLAEGVLLMTVPFDDVGPDEREKGENLLRALDVIGFKSRAEPELEKRFLKARPQRQRVPSCRHDCSLTTALRRRSSWGGGPGFSAGKQDGAKTRDVSAELHVAVTCDN